MPPKKIHEDFMETLGKKSPSYSKVKIMGSRIKEGERESSENDGRSGRPTDKNVKVVHTQVFVIRGETCEA